MTNDEFLKILPAYIGCELRMKFTDTKSTLVAFVPSGANPDVGDLYYEESYGTSRTTTYISAFKLILRPLSEIIGEDKSEYEHLYTLQVLSIHDDMIVQTSAKMINYLRSKGYDCDNLIESGFAITNTK